MIEFGIQKVEFDLDIDDSHRTQWTEVLFPFGSGAQILEGQILYTERLLGEGATLVCVCKLKVWGSKSPLHSKRTFTVLGEDESLYSSSSDKVVFKNRCELSLLGSEGKKAYLIEKVPAGKEVQDAD